MSLGLTLFVEHHDGISVIRSGQTVRSWNGIQYQTGLSAKSTNARQLSMSIKQSIENGPGDFIYIEPGVPHEVSNLSDTEPVVVVVTRSDATDGLTS